jgi:50S ribosomal subunit-associated GTPase HflX
LEFGQIPRLVVFNKADLVEPDSLEAMLRLASQNGARECISVSAVDPQSLRPMLEKAGAILARDLVKQRARDEQLEMPEEQMEYALAKLNE